MRSILFVCTANICRSPTAEGVLRRMLSAKGLVDRFQIESAGTHDYHEGKPPFPAAVEIAKRRGYDITLCISRRVSPSDFDQFDLILAMDRSNLANLRSIAPTRCKQKIELLLEYGDEYHGMEIPDPYNGKEQDYIRTIDMIEDGCRGLVELLARSTARST
jgi:protein-tyrosine phosphatase